MFHAWRVYNQQYKISLKMPTQLKNENNERSPWNKPLSTIHFLLITIIVLKNESLFYGTQVCFSIFHTYIAAGLHVFSNYSTPCLTRRHRICICTTHLILISLLFFSFILASWILNSLFTPRTILPFLPEAANSPHNYCQYFFKSVLWEGPESLNN